MKFLTPLDAKNCFPTIFGGHLVSLHKNSKMHLSLKGVEIGPSGILRAIAVSKNQFPAILVGGSVV